MNIRHNKKNNLTFSLAFKPMHPFMCFIESCIVLERGFIERQTRARTKNDEIENDSNKIKQLR